MPEAEDQPEQDELRGVVAAVDEPQPGAAVGELVVVPKLAATNAAPTTRPRRSA